MSQATISAEPYLNSNLFSNYYLDERVYDLDEWDCDEEAREAMEEIQALYEQEGEFLPDNKEDALLDVWIDVVLDVLGFESIPEATLPDGGGYVDRTLFGSAEQRLEATRRKQEGDAKGLFNRSLALLEAKQWGHDFESIFSEQRQYRNASHQIKHYLEKTPRGVSWGILTDGKKWRLYGSKDYEPQTYYEVDLPELLASGDVEKFKRFFVFFRAEAFRESAGTTFLDEVWSESESAAQELGEDIQDNVFTALRVLGEGFVETNDLNIKSGDDESLSELKEQSLVLLYRLMFVLYAESRDLIHPESPSARTEYEENFSLETLREEIKEIVDAGGSFDADFSEHSTKYWSQLEDLFGLIDTGQEDLGVPPYNGGLFDPEKNEFLAENEMANRYIAEAIYLISTTESETSDEIVFADYADLDTRHLGGIYEGLLEHQFRVAGEDLAAVAENGGQEWKPADEVTVAESVEVVDRGELYVVNDEGERKATGAYYTPDYVVTYIIEETINPLLDEIRNDLEAEGLEPGDPEYYVEFKKRVLDLTLLDPAMGSGHFLTKATEHLAESIMAEARELVSGGNIDGQQVRREVSKECIYGVDLNEMAVELAKLSMWLETLAADQPLAFLDHHFKSGNSIVGSDIESIEGLESDASDDDSDQYSLAEFGITREGTIERLMDIYQEFLGLENENLEDVKEMERKYYEIEDDKLRQRLVSMANVQTAEGFGADVPSGAFERMATALEDDSKWEDVADTDWFKAAQALAEEQDFFHWKLEFPEIFYDEDGTKSEDSGFDAIGGNPPYVRQEQLGETKQYLRSCYDSYHGVADLYTYFIEQGVNLLAEDGQFGYIVSNKFTRADYGEGLREFLTSNTRLRQILDFGDLPVFPDASAYPMILILQNGESEETPSDVVAARFDSLDFSSFRERALRRTYTLDERGLSTEGWSLVRKEVGEIVRKCEESNKRLEERIEDIHYGIKTGLNDAFFIDEETREWLIEQDSSSEDVIKPLAIGDDIRRYYVEDTDKYLIFTKRGTPIEQYPAIKEHLEQYKDSLEPEPPDYTGDDWGGRKAGSYQWFEIQDKVEYWETFEENKIAYPVIANQPRFAIDEGGYYMNDKCFIIPSSSHSLLAKLNSKLAEFWLRTELSILRGGYQEFRATHVKNLPIATDDDLDEKLAENACELSSLKERRNSINLFFPDYLGNHDDGPTLGEITSTPPEGFADSILVESQGTTDEFEKLRVTDAEVRRDGDVVTVFAVPYVKPVEAVREDYETNGRGYATLDPEPAMVF